MNEFYVLGADGRPSGPHDIEAIVRLVQSQQIARDTQVAAVGQSQWAPMMSVAEIAKRFETPSKRPPGPPPRRSNPPPAMTPTPAPAPVQTAAAPAAAAAPPTAAPAMTLPSAAAMPAPTSAPAQAPAPAPAAAPAPSPAAAAAVAPAVAPAAAAEKKEEKKEEKKPTLDPKYNKLPWLIFGAFAFVTLILFIIALVRSPPKEEYGRIGVVIDASHA
jgi:hypothetical protein